jgi:hypothetical protein
MFLHELRKVVKPRSYTASLACARHQISTERKDKPMASVRKPKPRAMPI